MLFCYFWNYGFCNLRMTLAKKLFGTETLNLQVKFHSRVASMIGIFNIIKRNSKFYDPYFHDKWPVSLKVVRSKKHLPTILSNVTISVLSSSFYRKNVRKKVNFFQNC